MGPVRAEPLPYSHPKPIDLSGRLEAARGHARSAWRPTPDRPAVDALAPRIDGEVITLVADAGEFDGDWSDPVVVQRALFVVVEGVRRAAPTLDPHFIVVLSTFTVEAPTALYLPLANDVRGIGYRYLEPAETFRFTPGRLDGVVFMNTVRAADAPVTEALFLQELGHRWGVYTRVADGDGTRLLGRDCAHWSHFARFDASAMEGNPWVEVEPGRHVAAVPDAVGYDPAMLYLMGVIPAADVSPISLVSRSGWPCFGGLREGRANPRHGPPTWRTGIPAETEGAPELIPWSAVVQHEGQRAPSHELSRRAWSAVFVLIARSTDDPTTAVPLVDGARMRWSAAFGRATTPAEGPGLSLETTRAAAAFDAAPGSVGFGGRCLDALDCDADWPRCVPTESGDRICTADCIAHGACAAGACCVPAGDGQSVCAPSVDPCPAVDLDDAGIGDASTDAAPPDAVPPDASRDAAAAADGGRPGSPSEGCGQGPGRRAPGWSGLLLCVLLWIRSR